MINLFNLIRDIKDKCLCEAKRAILCNSALLHPHGADKFNLLTTAG